MKLKLGCFLFAVLLGLQVCAQEPVADWFPVHVGDKFIYETRTRNADTVGRLHIANYAWKTEETTIGSWSVAEGTVVVRQSRVVEGSPEPGWRVNLNQLYLISGDCIYGPGYEVDSWDPSTHQLKPDFRNGLSTDLAPDFCFPLVEHQKWGAPHGLPDWNVKRPEDAKDWEVLGIKPAAPNGRTTFHVASISAYPGSGLTLEIWFEKGVGVVKEDEIHHGTIGETKIRLVRFERAK